VSLLTRMYEGMSLMGSGETVHIEGSESLPSRIRRQYSNLVKESYYKSLGDITTTVLAALEELGLVPVVGDEKWVGTFNGAMSSGETVRLRIDLVRRLWKDAPTCAEIKNSVLVLDIYKNSQAPKPYELNSYLS